MRLSILAGSLAALAIAVAACDTRTGSSGEPPARPSASVSGHAVTSPSCDVHPAGPLQVQRRTIDLLVLCPLETRPGKVVRLRSGSPLFDQVVRGLATAGRRFPPGTPCPAYADVEQTVLARSDGQWLLVDLPRDSCGHYDRGLLTLLARARGG